MEQKFPVPAGMHVLPPLPYAYNALEPVIDAETMEIHHDKLHKKYVDELNKTELALVEARKIGDYANIGCLENKLAFNGSGHILHSIYWTIMTKPDSGGQPGKYTTSYINWYFGDFIRFKAQFTAAATTVEASGWCVLGYQPAFGRLEILQCEKHQNLTQWGMIPVLVCDVWEHAYFLKYKNLRDAYIKEWWRLVNWAEVESRFLDASGAKEPIMIGK